MQDLIDRAERVRRTSDSLIRRMQQLAADIAQAKARANPSRKKPR